MVDVPLWKRFAEQADDEQYWRKHDENGEKADADVTDGEDRIVFGSKEHGVGDHDEEQCCHAGSKLQVGILQK